MSTTTTTPIGVLDISARAKTAISKIRFDTIESLVDALESLGNLRRLAGVGDITADELRSALDAYQAGQGDDQAAEPDDLTPLVSSSRRCPRCDKACYFDGSARDPHFTYWRCPSPNCRYYVRDPREHLVDRHHRPTFTEPTIPR